MLIEPISSESATVSQRAALEAARSRFGRDIAPAAVIAHHDAIMTAVGGFEAALRRADRLPARLSHLVNLKVAALLGCSFCIDIGSHIARQDGVSADAVADLPRFRDSDAYSPAERAALAAAEVMTVGDCVLEPALQQALREHFDEAQLVELLAVIAWENYRSRFNRAAGMQAAGFCPASERAASEQPAANGR
jgi:AhpD family alkylhydroperoxidase